MVALPAFVVSISLLVSMSAVVGAADETVGAPPTATYANGLLSVRATAAPLPEVLSAIGRATGAELRGRPADAPPVTVRLEVLPVKDALERILGSQSFALVLGDDGRVRAIDLRGGPQTALPRKTSLDAPEGWTPSQETVEAAVVVDQWAQRDTRYPVSGRLAEALGGTEATFSQITEAALANPDRAVRAQALRTSLRLLEGTEEVRDAFVRLLGTLDDAFLTNYARLAMKDNAMEIVAGMAQRSSAPAVRTRAQGVLRELHANPTP
jgi:hypothetical protein